MFASSSAFLFSPSLKSCATLFLDSSLFLSFSFLQSLDIGQSTFGGMIGPLYCDSTATSPLSCQSFAISTNRSIEKKLNEPNKILFMIQMRCVVISFLRFKLIQFFEIARSRAHVFLNLEKQCKRFGNDVSHGVRK